MAAIENEMVMRPGDGTAVPGLGMTHKVDGKRLAGRLLVMEGVIPPGTLIHPHTHTREDECSFILDGELQYLVGDAVFTAGPGSYVPKPRGVRHAFWNRTAQPARVMEMHTPATFDTYYDELEALFQSYANRPDGLVSAFDELAFRYGVTVHWDDSAMLVERYGAPAPIR
jgi:quercetin dioxygenase-like cupin family protein